MGLVSRVAMAAQQDSDYVALLNKLQRGEGRLNNDNNVDGNHPTAADEPLQGENEQGEVHFSPAIDEEKYYTVQDGVVFTQEGQILMLKKDELRTLIISKAHNNLLGGHFGQAKTLEKVRRL